MSLRAHKVVMLMTVVGVCVLPSMARAEFGIRTASMTSIRADGSAETQAGAHPFEFAVSATMNQNAQEEPEGALRDVIVDLPPGLIGNPRSLPQCTSADFIGQQPRCSGNSQIGLALIEQKGLEPTRLPVYNLTSRPGVAGRLGFSAFGVNATQEASVRTAPDLLSAGRYAVSLADDTIPKVPIQKFTVVIWGVPQLAAHNARRTCQVGPESIIEGCYTEVPSVPYLSLPTSCEGPLEAKVSVDSLEEPGNFKSAMVALPGQNGVPEGLTGCEGLPFSPSLEAQPDSDAADSPTGLTVNIANPQNEAPNGRAAAELKDLRLTLPSGLAVNPSSANGLGACSLGQVDLESTAPATCPPNSRLGTIEAVSPALDHPVPGAIYLAQQGSGNLFNALVGLYLVLEDPISGVVVKLPGKAELDAGNGQITATFENNPQLPVEHIKTEFAGGRRASLTTPMTCGRFASTSDLTPWTAPFGGDAHPSDSFQVTSGYGGGSCASSEAQLPNSPSVEAGTTAPLAGAYSPFVFKVVRQPGSQQLGSIEATLPQGLLGKLAGIPYCSDAQIAAAAARSNPGQGVQERANPSCPAASQVGTATVGSGSGTPLYVQGQVYLAGPYKEGPLSLVIVTPAVAGPFDLGTVVVRTALYIDPSTAQITAKSDPLPRILQGVPLDIRSVALQMDRRNFTLNPTSCEPKEVGGSLFTAAGATAVFKSRFQVGGCAGLSFKPTLSLGLNGPTKRGKDPALKAVLTQPIGQANIGRVAVVLPKTEFIDQRHINSPCTRVQFNVGMCPPKSILGHAKAWTPLLERPLEGPIYFRSNGGERRLPDLVLALHGQIDVNLVGFIDSVRTKGTEISRVRTTFASVPDAPVSRVVLEMKGGKKGLLTNSANLCKVKSIAQVKMTGQNSLRSDFQTQVANRCPKKRRK